MRILGFDLPGRFSKRQVKKIKERLDPQLHPGTELVTVEITCFNDSIQWFLFVGVGCRRHGQLIAEDSACEICLGEKLNEVR